MSLRANVSASHHFSDFWCHLYFSSPCLCFLAAQTCSSLFFFLSHFSWVFFFCSWNDLSDFWVLWERQTHSLAHTNDSHETTLFSGLKPGSLQPEDHPRLDCALCRGKLTCHQPVGAVGVVEKGAGAVKPEHSSRPCCSATVSRHRMTYTCLNDGNKSSCRCGPPLACKVTTANSGFGKRWALISWKEQWVILIYVAL